MFRVLTCLTDQHDWRLVLLAGLVCFVASIVAVNIFHRAIASQSRTRLIWTAIAGAAIGYGIWATHFIAMLAYEPGVPTGYGMVLTALSLAAAMILTSSAFGIAAEAAKWPAHLKIAVNLSPAQFRSKELVPVTVSALANSGIMSPRLELEVTETVMMHDSEAVFATLGQLRKLGVRIALDDFGTGYSSLSFLQKFAFDKIKIDRSFVKELSNATEESRLIARAVVRFAVSLGKTTTAEGVETKEQLDLLRAEACVEVQGYYLGRPMHSSKVAQMVHQKARRAVHAA